ncbi:MAG: hypothetical protein ABIJ97_02220 [Bacteroidota bacterium]
MNFKIYILFAIICLLSASCEKNAVPTIIEGKVIDKETKDPVIGASVELVINNFGYNESYGGTNIRTSTDNNGDFKIKFYAINEAAIHDGNSGHYLLVFYKEPDYPFCEPNTGIWYCTALNTYCIINNTKREITYELKKP